MPHPLAPIDAEAALASDLATITGIECAPVPIPEDLGEASMPFASVEQVGGRRTSLVVDSFTFSVGCYGLTPGAAVDAARRIAAAVEFLDSGLFTGSAQWLRTAVATEPYADPDPRHPTLARRSLRVEADARAVQADISSILP